MPDTPFAVTPAVHDVETRTDAERSISGRRGRHPRIPSPGNPVWFCMALGLLLALVLAGWALGELSRSVLTMSDLDAVRDVASERSSQLTAIAHVLSAFGSGYVVAPLAVVVAVLLFARGRRTAALAIAVSTLGAAAISTSDKLLVGRPRPPVEHLEAVSTASFPSGHTTTAAAFYLALLIVLIAVRPRRGSMAALSCGLVFILVLW